MAIENMPSKLLCSRRHLRHPGVAGKAAIVAGSPLHLTGPSRRKLQAAQIQRKICSAACQARQLVFPALRRHPDCLIVMPLPNAPTQKPNNVSARRKANGELLLKGVLCILIGLGVLVSPHFISSPGMQGIVAKSSLVGWFALVLGLAFGGMSIRRRLAERKAQ
jgi:hypothetical protein